MFVTYEDKIESKGVQVPAELPLIKSVGAANRQSPAKPRNFVALYHRRPRLGCVLTNAVSFCSSRKRPSSTVLPIHNFHIDHNAPCLPPEFCITIVFSFSWVLQLSQEKSKTMVMQSFGGLTWCIMVYVKMVNTSLKRTHSP